MNAVGLEFTEFGGAGVRITVGNGPPRIQALTFEQQDPRDPKFPRAYALIPAVVRGKEGDPGYALGVPALLAGEDGLRRPAVEETTDFLFRLILGGRVSLGAVESAALCLTSSDIDVIPEAPELRDVAVWQALGSYADLIVGTETQVTILYLSSERIFAVRRTPTGSSECLLTDQETHVQPGLIQRALEALGAERTETAIEASARFGVTAFCGTPEFQLSIGGREIMGSALAQELRRQSRRAPEVVRAISLLPDSPVLLCGPIVGESPPACSPSRLARLLENREVVGSSRWSPWALSVGCAWANLRNGVEKC